MISQKRAWKKKLAYLKSILNQAQRLSERSLLLLNILFPMAQEKHQSFISKPLLVLQQIILLQRDIIIRLDKSSYRTLEIVYPESILGIIINELITNSIKHNPASQREIMVSWHITNFMFNCSVHDNGIGIVPNLNKTNITASDVLDSLRYGRIKPNGLFIVNRLILKSKGTLSFTKSKQLGGTLAAFSIPVCAYYLRGHVYESQ